ncbi:MAG: HEAT repeat domain-containing protein, partial [Planctomycetota bacterium]|nr:HEAT repeat domain-containing protein [Planctomycetota bacterium]
SSSKESLEAQLSLLNDESRAVREWVLYSLSQCQTAQLGELNQLLEKDFDENYPEFGILSRDIGSRFIPVLVKRLASEDSDVRYYATYFLSQLGETATTALFQSLKDPDALVRQMAAKGLARIGTRAGPALIQLLVENKSRSDQILVLSILSKLATCPIGALPHLLERLKSEDVQLRCLAIDTILRVEKPGAEVLPALTPLLSDPNWTVRRKAKDALEQLRRVLRKKGAKNK